MSRISIIILAVAALTMGCDSQVPDAEAGPKSESTSKTAKPEESPADSKKAGPRIVAMGDVHGDASAMKKALKTAGILAEDGKSWTGGSTIFVQTGDLLDRGDDEREVVDLMLSLRSQAKQKGGRVVLLNGNHELMNSMGDLRYVTPKAMNAFDDAAKPEDLERVKDAPEPIRGRMATWGPVGPYAKAVAQDGVIAVIHGNVFVHGGVLPKHAGQVTAINNSVKKWLTNGGEPPKGVVGDSESPVWTRIYSAPQPTPQACEALSGVLKTLGAKRMFVGHTVQKQGVNSACDGKVWRIDVGMSAHYGGEPAAVEIRGDQVRVLK